MYKTIRQVVIRIHQENIRQWPEAPLKPAVHIKVFELGIVLQKCCPEDGIGESNFKLLVPI